MTTIDNIKNQFPLHWLVWDNSYLELKDALERNEQYKEQLDPRGRTPLMLAVTLGHIESVQVLLDAEADVNCEKDGWTAVQEAVSTGDPDLVALVLKRRDYQRHVLRSYGVPELLQKLNEAPDFYVEMRWEFTSWVPLVSRMCPFDTYKVYKRGANVRIDTTLLGFDQNKWQRGNKTYLFRGQADTATLLELDHNTRQFWSESFQAMNADDAEANGASSHHLLTPSSEAISQRLTAPICVNYIDTEKISFERNKSGIWGWRQDKAETVNGHECKVFGASNVEFVSKTRTEHLSEGDKARARGPRTPLQSFLGMAETEERTVGNDSNKQEYAAVSNPCNISPEEYFSRNDLNGRDIGRPKELNTKIQKFKATLWLCETYPLQLQEQIMPILDLMASMSSPHFAKLKDFIQMQLPSGFPVKIEIPLFHVLNARITFGNIFAMDEPVPHVMAIREGERHSCVLDEECFAVPPSYSELGEEDRRHHNFEDEDDLLQYAIQQSLIEAGSERDEVDIWEALKAQKPSRPVTPNFITEEERQLQRAIQASLASYHQLPLEDVEPPPSLDSSPDADLQTAILLSQQDSSRFQQERLREQRELDEILKLSLVDK